MCIHKMYISYIMCLISLPLYIYISIYLSIYLSLSIYIYIYIYIYTYSKIRRFGSVRFGKLVFPVRRGSACVFRTRRGLVWFGSVRFRVRVRRFRNYSDWFASVRLCLFGSVSYSFLQRETEPVPLIAPLVISPSEPAKVILVSELPICNMAVPSICCLIHKAIHIYIYIYLSLSIYIYIYIYIHTYIYVHKSLF